MSRRKQRIPSLRKRKKGFKIHLMNYLGVMGFLWFIYLFTNPGGYPWPVWPMMGWGLGIFFHFVRAILAPKWGEDYVEEEEIRYEEDRYEEKFSSEYEIPSQRRRDSRHESWDGVDVQVHDIDDK